MTFMLLSLASLSFCVASNPYAPYVTTWRVYNTETGAIASKTSHDGLPRDVWFPDLQVDLYDLLGERWDPREPESYPSFWVPRWESQQGWFKGWFNSSRWLTTLISTLLEPLLILLLLLTFGPCILNHLLRFIRERLSITQALVLSQQYQALKQQEGS